MIIEVVCICGKRVAINEDLAGQDINCMHCGRAVQLPTPKLLEPESEETSVPVHEQAPAASYRDSLYWLVALFLFPLAYFLGRPETESFVEQLERTLSTCPPAAESRARQIWEDIKTGRSPV